MTAQSSMPIRFFVTVGDTQVLNLLGGMDLDVTVEPITDETRLVGDAPEATFRVVDFDIVQALRSFADHLEEVFEDGGRPGPVL